MASDAQFYVGKTVRGRVRVMQVNPVSGTRTPETAATSVTIRFRRPDGTILATRSSGSGVTNAGQGYYYGDAVPDISGLHTVEFESGGVGAPQGREKLQFSVEAF